ncbi:Protein NRT1/ PTR FAMILY 6.4 [Capsicum chinense]|nr:Protein NRT1/ PTR FAMILY 6.4 [Capsicum chinense]
MVVKVLNELKVSGEDFINEVASSPLKGLIPNSHLKGLKCGFLTDAKLASYLVVAVFASIATVGVTLLTLATSIRSIKPHKCDPRKDGQCIESSGQQLALLYTSLYTLALDGVGIKSNIFGFGSDQFDPSDLKENKSLIYFFNRKSSADGSFLDNELDKKVPAAFQP